MTQLIMDKYKLLAAVPAQTAVNSIAVPMEKHIHASFHVIWASLTAAVAISATITLQVSNDPRVVTDPTNASWDSKSGATFAITSANGNKMISLNDVVTENYYRVAYTISDVTAGTVTCHMTSKGY